MRSEKEIRERIKFLHKKLDWIYQSDKKIPADQSDVESFIQLSVKIEALEWVLSGEVARSTTVVQSPYAGKVEGSNPSEPNRKSCAICLHSMCDYIGCPDPKNHPKTKRKVKKE